MAGSVKKLRAALYIGVLGGVLSFLPDIDHIPALRGAAEAARVAHTGVFVDAVIIGVLSLACLAGLLAEVVLKVEIDGGMDEVITGDENA